MEVLEAAALAVVEQEAIPAPVEKDRQTAALLPPLLVVVVAAGVAQRQALTPLITPVAGAAELGYLDKEATDLAEREILGAVEEAAEQLGVLSLALLLVAQGEIMAVLVGISRGLVI